MISANYESGQPLPKDLIQRKVQARSAFLGLYFSRQLMLTYLSLQMFRDSTQNVTSTTQVTDPFDLSRQVLLEAEP